MPYYFVIDTNCWRNLVSTAYYNTQLDQILRWIRQGDLVFLVSDALQKEWDKHRQEQTKFIKDQLRMRRDRITSLNLFNLSVEIPDINVSEAERLLVKQIEVIDSIFENGTKVNQTTETKAIIFDHHQMELAPFHEDKNSYNDAIIIFTAMAYINSFVPDKVLYFVTGNDSDFASSDHPDQLHPDISKEFKNVTVHYFTKWTSAYDALIKAGLKPTKKTKGYLEYNSNVFNINKKAPVLQQLHELLTKRFKEFAFLPKQYFENQYPLDLDDAPPKPEGRDLMIYTNNEPLFQELTRISSSDNLSAQEMETVQLLHQNWVSEITYLNRSTSTIKFAIQQQEPSTLRKHFETLEFDLLLALINNPASDYNNAEKAFYIYQLYDWPKAVHFYTKAMTDAKKTGKKALQFIAGYGAIILQNSVKTASGSTGNDKNAALPHTLTELQKDCYREDIDDILTAITRDTFMISHYEQMMQIYRKIQLEYQDGATGTTGSGQQFIVSFFQVHEFITRNYLAYVHFGYYQQFVGWFINGVLMSNACSADLDGKVAFLSDDLLVIMLHYCKADDIQKYVRWYGIKDVKRLEQSNQVITHCIEFIRKYPDLVREWSEVNGAYPLGRICYEKLPNLLAVLSIVQLTDDEIALVAKHLYALLRRTDYHLHSEIIRYIGYFLSQKGCKAPSLFLPLANPAIANKRHYDTNLVSYIKRTLKQRDSFSFDPTDFSQLLQNLDALQTEGADVDTFYFLYDVFDLTTDDNQRIRLLAFIKNITQKDTKDPTLYAIGVVLKLFPHDPVQFLRYVQSVTEQTEIDMRHPIEYRWQSPLINNFINYCFKEQIEISANLKTLFSSYLPYYEWLLNLERFDYTRFIPEWLYEYNTLYFKNHFRKSKTLPAHLLGYLRDYPLRAEVSQFYINTYVREQ